MGEMQRVDTSPALQTVDAAKPFYNFPQLKEMDRPDLEALVMSLQVKTMVRRTAEGSVVCVQRMVPLAYGRAEDVYEIPKIGAMINAKGYRKLAAYAGVKFFTPATLMVDGVAKSNPCIERHPVTKSNQRCWVRMVAVWRGPLGEPIARDLTLCYDPGSLFVVSLRGKRDSNPAAIISTSRRLDQECEPGWAFFPEMDLPGTEMYVGLYVNLANPDVSDLIKDRSDKSKFIERYATTFCERNLTKKMLPVNVPYIPKDDKGNAPAFVSTPIMAWVAPSDEAFMTAAIRGMQGIEDVADPVRSLEDRGVIIVVEAETHEGDDSDRDENESDDPAHKDDANPESKPAQRTESKTPAPAAVAPEQPALNLGAKPDLQAMKDRLAVARSAIGDGAYRTACAEFGIDPEKPMAKGTAALATLTKECEAEARRQDAESRE
jgi:hypothetical protein